MDDTSWCAVLFFMANAIYVASYAVTNMLVLRVLTVIAGITTLPYFYLQAEPLWLAMLCQSMFVSINLYHLGRLLLPDLMGFAGSGDIHSARDEKSQSSAQSPTTYEA